MLGTLLTIDSTPISRLRAPADEMAAKVRAFADAHIDHMQIDRDARIPDSVVKGLADIVSRTADRLVREEIERLKLGLAPEQ